MKAFKTDHGKSFRMPHFLKGWGEREIERKRERGRERERERGRERKIPRDSCILGECEE